MASRVIRATFLEAPRLCGQQFDDLVLDECRVDVEHDESLRPAAQPFSLDRDVEAGLGCRRVEEVGPELAFVAVANEELVAHHGISREPDDAMDVAAGVGDGSGRGPEFVGVKGGAEHGDDVAPGDRGGGWGYDVEVDLHALFPPEQEHLLQEVPTGRHADHHAEGELAADDDLLDVLHIGPGVLEQGHQPCGDAWMVRAREAEAGPSGVRRDRVRSPPQGYVRGSWV